METIIALCWVLAPLLSATALLTVFASLFGTVTVFDGGVHRRGAEMAADAALRHCAVSLGARIMSGERIVPQIMLGRWFLAFAQVRNGSGLDRSVARSDMHIVVFTPRGAAPLVKDEDATSRLPAGHIAVIHRTREWGGDSFATTRMTPPVMTGNCKNLTAACTAKALAAPVGKQLAFWRNSAIQTKMEKL